MGLSIKQLNRVRVLRNSMFFEAMAGNYKGFKAAKKEYASLAVQDYETIRKLESPKISVPLFSQFGINMIYTRIMELFRCKTSDEKLLEKMWQNEKIAQKINQTV